MSARVAVNPSNTVLLTLRSSDERESDGAIAVGSESVAKLH